MGSDAGRVDIATHGDGIVPTGIGGVAAGIGRQMNNQYKVGHIGAIIRLSIDYSTGEHHTIVIIAKNHDVIEEVIEGFRQFVRENNDDARELVVERNSLGQTSFN